MSANKEINVKLQDFDFEWFAGRTMDFISTLLVSSSAEHPSSFIQTVDRKWKGADSGPAEGRSGFLEELKAGEILYFMFSSTGCDSPVPCADGEGYELPENEDDDDDVFSLGEIDTVGYALKLDKDVLTIYFAYSFGGDTTMPLIKPADCGPFTKPMKKYIQKYIRASYRD